MSEERTVVVVMRVADGPPRVKSVQVSCSYCHEACWLDEKGLPTLDDLGTYKILCVYCYQPVAEEDEIEMRMIRGGVKIPNDVARDVMRWHRETFSS